MAFAVMHKKMLLYDAWEITNNGRDGRLRPKSAYCEQLMKMDHDKVECSCVLWFSHPVLQNYKIVTVTSVCHFFIAVINIYVCCVAWTTYKARFAW